MIGPVPDGAEMRLAAQRLAAPQPPTIRWGLLVVGAGLLHLGCYVSTLDHPADLGLPFEALPRTADQPSCSVFFSRPGAAGRLGDLESYAARTHYADQSQAERRERFLDLLHRRTEKLRPGDQMIGHTSWQEDSINPLDGLRLKTEGGKASWQVFVLYASCLTEEGAFHCRDVPMAAHRRGSIACPFEPFPWFEADLAAAVPEAIEVEYTSIPCSKKHGVFRRSCRGGWFVKLHGIRVASGERDGESTPRM